MLINVLNKALPLVSKLIPQSLVTIYRGEYKDYINEQGVVDYDNKDLIVTQAHIQPLSSHELAMFTFSTIDAQKCYKLYFLKKTLINDSFHLTSLLNSNYDYKVVFYDPHDHKPYSHKVHAAHDWRANGWHKVIVTRHREEPLYENKNRHKLRTQGLSSQIK